MSHTLTSYVHLLGQALSLIFILCIAKHAAWNKSTMTSPVQVADMDPYAGVVPQEKHVHNANANGQVYYYQQAPVYNGAENTIKT
jgi:hypothetical protein